MFTCVPGVLMSPRLVEVDSLKSRSCQTHAELVMKSESGENWAFYGHAHLGYHPPHE